MMKTYFKTRNARQSTAYSPPGVKTRLKKVTMVIVYHHTKFRRDIIIYYYTRRQHINKNYIYTA